MNTQASTPQAASADPTRSRVHPVVRGAMLGVALAWTVTTIVYVVGNVTLMHLATGASAIAGQALVRRSESRA